MDDFVRNKLTEWGLSDLIEIFEGQAIDKESLYCLGKEDIDQLIPLVGPRAKFKKRLQLLKEEQNTNQETAYAQCTPEHEGAADTDQESGVHVHPQVLPSTSDQGKRKVEHQDMSSKWQSPNKRQRTAASFTEPIILEDVKLIMEHVNGKLSNQDNTKLKAFLRTKIKDLMTDKRELVGVFGKTGAGKSSLINAIIGEKDLLPSGSISACTTVMIKVEANMSSPKYEANIELITKEEWKDELWSSRQLLVDNEDEEKEEDDEYRDIAEKLSALYGEEWKAKSWENLMDPKYFREIPEFLQSRKKTFACESAKELSAKLVKYTRTNSKQGEGTEVKKWYWPLVKCVTIKVPDSDLLQHVTLVDLPGNGDRNKSRDQMWKDIVGKCSAVWIATEMNRAGSEAEAWDILKSASSIMGNGGQCQHIHFICTKSDLIDDVDDLPAAAHIVKRNKQAKDQLQEEFSKMNQIKKHFSEDCFKVFTVSSKEFLKEKTKLNKDDTEIPRLQDFLQSLNDCHSATLNYVSGADGILSLIQGASRTLVESTKMDVRTGIERTITCGFNEVQNAMEEAYKDFEKCLTEGVEKSQHSCDGKLKSILYPRKPSARNFYRTLKSVVVNGGVHKTKKGKQFNIHMTLASDLTDSVDEKFRMTFPNDRKSGPIYEAISNFSLDTETLIEKYKDVELRLIFLRTEEENMKTKLNNKIRKKKKTIYSSLTDTIEEIMTDCYKRAARFEGGGSLRNMRETIENHVRDSKTDMFNRAKDVMLKQLNELKEDILKTLKENMAQSVDHALESDSSIPDVSVERKLVKKYLNELKRSQDEDPELSLNREEIPGTLPLPRNLHQWQGTMQACHLCRTPNASLQHILSSCKSALSLGEYKRRHDQVLKKLAELVERRTLEVCQERATESISSRPAPNLLSPGMGWRMQVDLDTWPNFPAEICSTTLRPDIVLWNKVQKKVWLIELTVPWGGRFKEAHERKTQKYADLVERCRSSGWNTRLYPVEVSTLGPVAASMTRLLEDLGLRGAALNKAAREVADEAEKASLRLWQRVQAKARGAGNSQGTVAAGSVGEASLSTAPPPGDVVG